MDIQTAKIVKFYELSEEWQEKAKSNLDEFAEEAMYLEPKENTNPKEHVLYDLNKAMINKGIYNGFKYNTVIVISNNSAMLLQISDDNEEAKYIYV